MGLELKLFETGYIGTLKIKNRIVMAPMGLGRMAEPDGEWGKRVVDYYAARARGGTGLITTELVFVSQKLEPEFTCTHLNLHLDRHKIGLEKVARAVHRHGAMLSLQLTAGFGRVLRTNFLKKSTAVSASAVPCFWDNQLKTRELSVEELEDLIQEFGYSARVAKEAGVDAIELHGHEGYLFDQFKTSLWNKRKDQFGGDLEGRLRLSIEAIRAIKAGAGTDFPVIYRYGINHYLEGGRDVNESLEIARKLETERVDALHVDAGCYETAYWPHPTTYQEPGCMVDMAESVKSVVRIPVIAVGKLGYPELAERVLQERKADFIALGRPLLTDPEWPIKVMEGRTEDINVCIGDHDGCMGKLNSGSATCCTVNPAVGNEKKYTFKPVRKRKSVLVIGGGPAGMEAAMVARQRGHHVFLWEKEERLGGNLIPASVPKFKSDLGLFTNYLSIQVNKLGVEVQLGKEARSDEVKKFAADVVIIATGANPIIPDIPLDSRRRMLTPIDVLLGKGTVGSTAIVVGGGVIGCETAVFLAQRGIEVKLTTRRSEILTDVYHANKIHLQKMLTESGVDVRREVEITSVVSDGLEYFEKGVKKEFKVQTIIMALGLKSEEQLVKELEGKIETLYPIGDCVKPRRIIDAIWEGFEVMKKL